MTRWRPAEVASGLSDLEVYDIAMNGYIRNLACSIRFMQSYTLLMMIVWWVRPISSPRR